MSDAYTLTLPHMRRISRKMPPARPRPRFRPALEALEARCLPATPGTTGLTADQVQYLYRVRELTVPMPGGGAATGQGQTMVIVNSGGITSGFVGSITLGATGGPVDNTANFLNSPRYLFNEANNLTQYGAFDPTGQTPFYLIVGTDGTTDSVTVSARGNGEFVLDAYEAHTIAPGANIVQVVLADGDHNYAAGVDIGAAVTQRLGLTMNVVSLSYGFQEVVPNQGPWNANAPNESLLQNWLQHLEFYPNTTFVVSSGDNGGGYQQLLDTQNGTFLDQYGLTTINSLATSPNVITAGGTYLDLGQFLKWADARGWSQPNAVSPEQGWGHDLASALGGFGVVEYGGSTGGFSLDFIAPAAQTLFLLTHPHASVPTDFEEYFKSVIPAKDLPSQIITPMQNARLGPDLALLASPASAGGDGTSAAAPKFAAMIALANQQRKARGLPPLVTGQALAMLYRAPGNAFSDVTVGQPLNQGGGTYAGSGYPVGPGFDLVTGRGAPNGAALVTYLGGNTFTPFYAVGAGPGAGPNVSIYQTGSDKLLFSFLAYNADFTGGVNVTCADLTGDGVPEVIAGPGAGGGPNVQVFDGASLLSSHGTAPVVLQSFFAYDPNFTGGVRVAAGNTNGNLTPNIITAPGPGGGPDINVFSGQTGALLQQFWAFDPAFTGGCFVAAGDITGDGFAEIVIGADAGGGPNVGIFSGPQNSMLRSFFAFDPAFTGGVRVVTGDVNGDGFADIATAPGAGGGPNVVVYNGLTLAIIDSFFAFTADAVNGVALALRDTDGDGIFDELLTVSAVQGQPDLRGWTALGQQPQLSFDTPLPAALLGGAGITVG